MKTSGNGKWANEIQMYVIKLGIWCGKSPYRSSCMASYCGFLAVGARVCPLMNIFVNARLHKTFSQKFLGSTDARMGEVM